MYNCRICGESTSRRLAKGLCTTCYQYFYRHGFKTYKKPPLGEVWYVSSGIQKGQVICNICGRAYNKLGSHIRHTHNISKNEYCDMFGIDRNNRLTSEDYNIKMHNYTMEYYDLVVKDNLLNGGKNTRFDKNHDFNYSRSLQTKRRLQKQGKVIGELYGRK